MISFNVKTDIQPCRLKKEDLFKLEEIINDSIVIPENSYSGISYVSTDLGGKSISEISVNDFLSNKDLPVVLNKLHLIRSGKDGSSNNINVDLNFYSNFITLSVNGDSESFVVGKATLIEDFLKSKRYKLWYFKSKLVLLLDGVLIALALGALSAAIKQILSNQSDIYSLPGVVFSLSVFILVYSMGRIPYTEIHIGTSVPFFEKKVEMVTFIFGIIGVIGVIWGIFR